jgi:hypothetical protein
MVSIAHAATHACTQQQQQLLLKQQYAYRFMDAGSCTQHQRQHACMPVHAYRLMHAYQLLLMRARPRRAYCKKYRVHLVP